MARRPTPISQAAPKLNLTPDDMRSGIARLTKRLEELTTFTPGTMTEPRPPNLVTLETAITRALERTFGENTSDFKRFAPAGHLSWNPGFIMLGGHTTPLSEYQHGTQKNCEGAQALLAEAIRTLQEELAEVGETPSGPRDAAAELTPLSRRIFVVHGHDDGPREAVARFLERLDLQPVILHEQANRGRTIITKFREEAADIGFAVVLMTPDDHGGKAGETTRPRARQNVVFELAFFIGRLGPDRVAALVKGQIEPPSDFEGVVYISFDDGGWRASLARELEAAGYHVDWNRVMRA